MRSRRHQSCRAAAARTCGGTSFGGGGGGGGGGASHANAASAAAARGASPIPGSANARAHGRSGGGGGGGAAVHQPAWRPGGAALPPPGSASKEPKGPRSWLTREELQAMVQEATRRAEAAEAAAEGMRYAAELLRGEVETSEAREAEAAAAAEAARLHALSVGDLEVRLREKLEAQGEQLRVAVEEEAKAREAAAASDARVVELEASLDASQAALVASAALRTERAERAAEMKELLAQARGTAAENDALQAKLAEANAAAQSFRTQAADEAAAKRSVHVALREARSALAKLREEHDAQTSERQAATAREAALASERLGALRHVNQSLEGRLRSLFDAKLKESSKASTLQEAVKMMTDEYVVVVDQLRTSQAALAAEQRRLAESEAAHAMAGETARRAIESKREAEAACASLAAEVRDVDMGLVPTLSSQAVAFAETRVMLAEAQRVEGQRMASASHRVQLAEAKAQRAEGRAAQQEEEIALLKKRLNLSVKKQKELQSVADDASGRHWTPMGPGSASHAGALPAPRLSASASRSSLSAPASPYAPKPGAAGKRGRRAARASSTRSPAWAHRAARPSSTRASPSAAARRGRARRRPGAARGSTRPLPSCREGQPPASQPRAGGGGLWGPHMAMPPSRAADLVYGVPGM